MTDKMVGVLRSATGAAYEYRIGDTVRLAGDVNIDRTFKIAAIDEAGFNGGIDGPYGLAADGGGVIWRHHGEIVPVRRQRPSEDEWIGCMVKLGVSDPLLCVGRRVVKGLAWLEVISTVPACPVLSLMPEKDSELAE